MPWSFSHLARPRSCVIDRLIAREKLVLSCPGWRRLARGGMTHAVSSVPAALVWPWSKQGGGGPIYIYMYRRCSTLDWGKQTLRNCIKYYQLLLYEGPYHAMSCMYLGPKVYSTLACGCVGSGLPRGFMRSKGGAVHRARHSAAGGHGAMGGQCTGSWLREENRDIQRRRGRAGEEWRVGMATGRGGHVGGPRW